MAVDYDAVAAAYENRYARNVYSGVERAVATFVGTRGESDQGGVAEVGCGTGHWVCYLRDAGIDVVGLDLSQGMLDVARARCPEGRLVRARAEMLPCRSAAFDRVFSVNALHHFTNPEAFFRESHRVLRRGGGVLIVGLDPHTGRDRWWIYDYFPNALTADRRRYLPARGIRELMEAASFSRCETREVQHIPAEMSVGEAARRGFLDRTSTSQLMVISQSEYDAGIGRIHKEHPDVEGGSLLRIDLRLYGTTGWV